MDYSIPIDSLASLAPARAGDRDRVLKSGDLFAVFNRAGELGRTKGEEGLYSQGCRHLSRWQALVGGLPPVLLNSTVRLDNSLMVVDQTTPDRRGDPHWALPKETLHIRRQLALHDGAMHEHLTLCNYHGEPVELTLEYRFGADFRDVFEVRGATRPRRGDLLEPDLSPQAVTLAYRGLDRVLRRTLIHFDSRPDEILGDRARFAVRLEPGTCMELESTVSCASGQGYFSLASHADVLRGLDLAVAAYKAEQTEVFTDNEQLNHWVNRSVADLQMLVTHTRCGPYPYAGVPWFSTPFGRDGLITALQACWVHPEMARGVLAFLAANQAETLDPASEAEPGKILHEMREGEMPALGEVPFRLYYGTVDATPLFVMLAGAYYRRTGDIETIAGLWPHIERAMAWMRDYGDADGDGLLEYVRHGDRGLVQQGWKDSDDSVFHADGSPAEPPIALCEVQAYAYAAYRRAAALAEALGHKEQAVRWAAQAESLKRAFDRAFWVEEIGTYALALDGDKRPCAVRTSNPGHALYCGIALPERAARIAEGLVGRAGFNGWGVRTVFAGEARYNPMSYHNGSVWPHDTAIAAAGLARYGFRHEALALVTGLFNAALFLDLHRLPELLCGFERLPGQAPTLYPVACMPQAWASGAVLMLLQACLGIGFRADRAQVRLDRPILPDYIDRLWLKGLRMGEASVDLALRRHRTDVSLHVERREGHIDVEVLF